MKKPHQNIEAFVQSVKAHFAKVFTSSDWWLFKKMAELNLREAAVLKKENMPIETSLRLLARNSRKRLLIGVGVELLLKSVYLKKGYMINKPPKGNSLKFPFSAKEARGTQLIKDKTFTLEELINNLPKIVRLLDRNSTLRGLKVAQVFRNKEGHVVTSEHKFDPLNYVDIAASLVQLYQDAFGEGLSVRFSVATNERAIWQVSRLTPSHRSVA